MSAINDQSFHATLNALGGYAEARTKLLAPRVLLKLEWQDGVPQLRVVKADEMTKWDKCKHFFGFGGYQLRSIVHFLQSKAFQEKLKTEPLESLHKRSIQAAAHSLDLKIKKYNKAGSHLFKVKTEEKTLSKSIRKYLYESKTVQEAPLAVKTARFAVANIMPEPKQSVDADSVQALLAKGVKEPKASIASDKDRQVIESFLATFEKDLHEAISDGRAVINRQGKVIGNASLQLQERRAHSLVALGGLELQDRFYQIRNRAYIAQQIHRLERNLVQFDLFMVNTMLQAQNKPLFTKQEVHALHKEALKNLLKVDEQLNILQTKELSHVRKLVKSLKIDVLLEARGCTLLERTMWLTAVRDIEKAYTRVDEATHAVAEMVKQDVSVQRLPPLAQQVLVSWVHGHANRLKKATWKLLLDTEIANLAAHKTSYEQFREAVVTKCSKQEAAFLLMDSMKKGNWGTLQQFYTKWKPNLSDEIVQGFFDAGEVLGQGICWALSLRWAKEEMNPEAAKVEGLGAKDRRLQAQYQLDKGEKRRAVAEKMAGVTSKSIDYFDVEAEASTTLLFSRNPLHAILQRLLDSSELQKSYQGVMQLCFWWENKGHAITVVYRENKEHPEQSILKIRDANFGTFQFPVTDEDFEAAKKALHSCLAELLSTYTSKIEQIESRGVS